MHYPTDLGVNRSFQVYWADDTIRVYHRVAEDGSDDRHGGGRM